MPHPTPAAAFGPGCVEHACVSLNPPQIVVCHPGYVSGLGVVPNAIVYPLGPPRASFAEVAADARRLGCSTRVQDVADFWLLDELRRRDDALFMPKRRAC